MKNILTLIKNKLALLLAITAAAIIGGATTAVVMAAIPDSNGVIHSCMTNATGAIKVIDSASQSCNGLETALNWDQQAGNSGLPFTCPGCDLTVEGSNLSGKNLSNAYLLNANFSGINLSNINFVGAAMTGANIGGANLTNSSLSGVDLTGVNGHSTDFSNSDLTNVNFTNAYLYGAMNLDTSTLTGVTWSNTICPDYTNSDNNEGTCAGHLTP